LGPETVLSPWTTLAALDTFSDIPVQDVREIAIALARTAIEQMEESRRRINSLSEQVQGLGDRLMGYEETFE
jgi:kynureninase